MFALSILAPVDFNDQPPFPANEIHDVRSNGLLPNEFHPVKRTRTPPIPTPPFSHSGMPPRPGRGGKNRPPTWFGRGRSGGGRPRRRAANRAPRGLRP